MSSLVIQTAFLGDVVLTTPLVRELAGRGPVDVVTTPLAAPLLGNDPCIRTLHVFDKRGRHRGARGLLALARALRRGSPDTAYLAQASPRSGLLALLSGARERVGFEGAAGRWFYTRRVPHRDGVHHAERLLRLHVPAEVALTAERLRPRLHPGEAEREAVDLLLRDAGHAGEPLVAVAPGSVWETKRWPGYEALAPRLAGLGRVVVIGSGGERVHGEAVRRVLPDAIDATGRLSLLASAELIRRCVLLVANDSSPTHLASAVGTPTVTIFGPTVPEFGFGPLAAGSATVGHPALPCRPCDRHGPRRCPLGHWRCMRDVTPEQVAATAHAAVNATGR